MEKIKENLKAVLHIQNLIKDGKKTIDKSELEKIGLNVTNSKIKIRNISIEKDFFGIWNLLIIDKKADLDGNLIAENVKFLKRLQNHYEAGETTIKFTEMIKDFNIYTSASDLNIGNFNLNSLLRMNVYDISLIDDKKTICGKWIDKAVDGSKVKEVLLKFEFNKEMIQLGEVQLNKEI